VRGRKGLYDRQRKVLTLPGAYVSGETRGQYVSAQTLARYEEFNQPYRGVVRHCAGCGTETHVTAAPAPLTETSIRSVHGGAVPRDGCVAHPASASGDFF
jgi:hypothetical protein